MKAKQLYYVLLACCCLAVLALVGTAYSADKLLSQQAAKLSTLRATSEADSLEQSSLVKDKKDIAAYSELNTIAKSVVPQDKDQAQAVSQIVRIAADSGISSLSSITFPASTLGATTSGTPHAAASSQSRLSQLTPVAGIAGVYNLQITISQDSTHSVPYKNFLAFLTGLEQNRRTAEVTSITVQPDTNSPGDVSFTLVVNEFIKP